MHTVKTCYICIGERSPKPSTVTDVGKVKRNCIAVIASHAKTRLCRMRPNFIYKCDIMRHNGPVTVQKNFFSFGLWPHLWSSEMLRFG